MQQRFASLDTLKVPAIIAVIWLHLDLFNASEYDHTAYRYATLLANQAARFAVPFFFLVSGYLYARALQRSTSPWLVFRRYSQRLLTLFFIWCVIYALIPPDGHTPIAAHVHDILMLIQHHPLRAMVHGTRPHLWFLIGLICSLLFLTSCIVLGHERLAVFGSALIYAVHLALNPYSVFGWHLPTQNTPLTACLFVVLGWTLSKHPISSTAVASSLAIGGFLLSCVEVIALPHILHTKIIFHSFLLGTVPFGVGVFAMAMRYPQFGEGTFWTALGQLTVGVYLSHMLVLDFMNSMDFWRSSPMLELSMPIIAYGICIILSTFYRYSRHYPAILNETFWQRWQVWKRL